MTDKTSWSWRDKLFVIVILILGLGGIALIVAGHLISQQTNDNVMQTFQKQFEQLPSVNCTLLQSSYDYQRREISVYFKFWDDTASKNSIGQQHVDLTTYEQVTDNDDRWTLTESSIDRDLAVFRQCCDLKNNSDLSKKCLDGQSLGLKVYWLAPNVETDHDIGKLLIAKRDNENDTGAALFITGYVMFALAFVAFTYLICVYGLTWLLFAVAGCCLGNSIGFLMDRDQ